MQENFINLCIQGKKTASDIDDFIDKWHDSTSQTPIWQFLGMTEEEYADWMEDPDVLEDIINSHKLQMQCGDWFSTDSQDLDPDPEPEECSNNKTISILFVIVIFVAVLSFFLS